MHGSLFPLQITVKPREICVTFCTERRVPRLGCMLVGWGGNNGATITAAVLANKLGLQWHTKHGLQSPNYYGSITQSSTVWLGGNGTKDVFVPMRDLLPLVDPNDIVFDGQLTRTL
jgi:myo-inositol-1-phosphate synthase